MSTMNPSHPPTTLRRCGGPPSYSPPRRWTPKLPSTLTLHTSAWDRRRPLQLPRRRAAAATSLSASQCRGTRKRHRSPNHPQALSCELSSCPP